VNCGSSFIVTSFGTAVYHRPYKNIEEKETVEEEVINITAAPLSCHLLLAHGHKRERVGEVKVTQGHGTHGQERKRETTVGYGLGSSSLCQVWCFWPTQKKKDKKEEVGQAQHLLDLA